MLQETYDFLYKLAENDHPFLFIVVLVLALSGLGQLIALPFKVVNRFLRHLNIRRAGWPPTHLDADGDWAESER